jgi:hypothetical protein
MIFVSDDTATINDSLLGLVNNGVRGGIWIANDDRFLDIHSDDASEERQRRNQKGERSHVCESRERLRIVGCVCICCCEACCEW